MRIATIARRGSSGWLLEVTARPAHSSQIFKEGYGAGAIYEASRILHTFYCPAARRGVSDLQSGAIVGGTETSYDRQESRGTAFGKSNVIAETAIVDGDLRFISEGQKARARETMSAIVALSLPETEAKISFFDGYPAMEPTEANIQLMETLGEVLRDLGMGESNPSTRASAAPPTSPLSPAMWKPAPPVWVPSAGAVTQWTRASTFPPSPRRPRRQRSSSIG